MTGLICSTILTRPRLSNYRAGSLLGCRSSLVGLSRRGRLRFLTAIQHNQPDHQETCQEKDYLKSFGFAIHFGLLSKSFAELNLVQTIYDTTKPNLTSPIGRQILLIPPNLPFCNIKLPSKIQAKIKLSSHLLIQIHRPAWSRPGAFSASLQTYLDVTSHPPGSPKDCLLDQLPEVTVVTLHQISTIFTNTFS